MNLVSSAAMPSAQTPQMLNEVTPQVQQITTRAPIHVVSPVKPYTLSNLSPTLRKVRKQQSKVHGKKRDFEWKNIFKRYFYSGTV